MSFITIKKISVKEVPQIITLLNTTLSFGLANYNNVSQYIQSTYAYCALDNNKVVGIITSKELMDPASEFLQHENVLQKLNECQINHAIIVKQLAVAQYYRGQGIGTNLLDQLLKQHAGRNFVTVGWITPSGWNAKSIFHKNSFQPLIYVKEFWLKDSLLKKYDCPYCKKFGPGCSCSAVICIKD
ncbi:GNAT family N-acetyltransferase [Paenibacillus ihuae]|uniref:GNAT family N-acetyltransferase n=1 Tax=Paenibacillus ihuae TaxID=1232431 RepID=UPI0006D53EA8|nr:GNAT family N-acetyltransferase [Paenibacillus ihuae]